MFKWKKLGLLFNPAGQRDWMLHYAQNPSTLVFDDVVRVYFCCRPARAADGSCVSYSGYVDLDRHDLFQVKAVAEQPLMPLGEQGTFDEFGCMTSCVVPFEDCYRSYYVGWTRMHSVPYNWAIGMGESYDGGKTFVRTGRGPMVGSCPDEPFLQACPVVRKYGDTWHMWYVTGLKWKPCGDKMESVYQLTHAVSADGIAWQRDGKPILPPVYEDECQTSAAIVEFDGLHHMFFTYRQSTDFRNAERGYRIGYAWSNDLYHWQRDDAMAGLMVSATGWDSEMVCYPHVFTLDGRVLMLYCGNDFGREGFGLAELER